MTYAEEVHYNACPKLTDPSNRTPGQRGTYRNRATATTRRSICPGGPVVDTITHSAELLIGIG